MPLAVLWKLQVGCMYFNVSWISNFWQLACSVQCPAVSICTTIPMLILIYFRCAALWSYGACLPRHSGFLYYFYSHSCILLWGFPFGSWYTSFNLERKCLAKYSSVSCFYDWKDTIFLSPYHLTVTGSNSGFGKAYAQAVIDGGDYLVASKSSKLHWRK